MGPTVTVTLDTNVLDGEFVSYLHRVARFAGLSLDVKTVTVNSRERGAELAPSVEVIPETTVWDESRWDESVWGGAVREPVPETDLPDGKRPGNSAPAGPATLTEPILGILASGSFPPLGSRENLSPGQGRQLRDVMSLEAHAREGREVFITNDLKGFVNHGRRNQLEELCHTRIVGRDEVGRLWP
ncbi:MAG TPA: hypothetical protein ENI86_09085 [Acidimicrobiales bacterium]|nr:hypothetical protein [Acidimicrobiales bacterium]